MTGAGLTDAAVGDEDHGGVWSGFLRTLVVLGTSGAAIYLGWPEPNPYDY